MNTNEKYILYHWLLSQEPEKPVLRFNTSGGPSSHGVIEVYPRDLMSLIEESSITFASVKDKMSKFGNSRSYTKQSTATTAASSAKSGRQTFAQNRAFAQKITKTPVEFVKTPDEEPFTNDPVQEHDLHAPRINSEAICEECGLELQGNEEYYFKLCEKHLTAFKNSLPEGSSFNEHYEYMKTIDQKTIDLALQVAIQTAPNTDALSGFIDYERELKQDKQLNNNTRLRLLLSAVIDGLAFGNWPNKRTDQKAE